MKCIKKTCSLILALLLAVSVLVLPAAALDNTWVTRFQTMPLIYSATATKPGNDVYVKAIQRYLFSNSSTRSTMGSTTVDGIWGTRTESAVKVFQCAMSLSLVHGAEWLKRSAIFLQCIIVVIARYFTCLMVTRSGMYIS